MLGVRNEHINKLCKQSKNMVVKIHARCANICNSFKGIEPLMLLGILFLSTEISQSRRVELWNISYSEYRRSRMTVILNITILKYDILNNNYIIPPLELDT